MRNMLGFPSDPVLNDDKACGLAVLGARVTLDVAALSVSAAVDANKAQRWATELRCMTREKKCSPDQAALVAWHSPARLRQADKEELSWNPSVNNCAHTLVVLVLCIFGTCRAFRLAEVFLTRCPFVKFSCAPVFVCLKGPCAYVCAVSFDVIRCTPCSETVLRPSS